MGQIAVEEFAACGDVVYESGHVVQGTVGWVSAAVRRRWSSLLRAPYCSVAVPQLSCMTMTEG